MMEQSKGGTAAVEETMERANEALGGFGVEAIAGIPGEDWRSFRHPSFWRDINALYVNMGDTYHDTILYDVGHEEFMVTTWGDWLETAEISDS